jgi:glutamine synthetase
MERFLSPEAYRAVITAIDEGTQISRQIADQVATGMQAWAMEHGVHTFTHRFHPLTDATAEKHDAFVGRGEMGSIIEIFSGEVLVSAGTRCIKLPERRHKNTFEARGYTAWDVIFTCIHRWKHYSVSRQYSCHTPERRLTTRPRFSGHWPH